MYIYISCVSVLLAQFCGELMGPRDVDCDVENSNSLFTKLIGTDRDPYQCNICYLVFLLMISISLGFSNVDDPIADRSQGHELPCGGYPDALFTELTDKDKDTYQCNIWYVRLIDGTVKTSLS